MGRPPPARVDPLRGRLHRPRCEHEEPIAGPGCPLVAEFCIAELGAVLGISSTAAKKLIGHALELRHRLPRLWAQVHVGCRAGLAGASGRGDHHPHLSRPDRRGRPVDRLPGRRRRRAGRHRAARPPRRRDHQALRPRRSGSGRGSGGRLPLGRPPPRHDRQGRRPLRRHPPPRGRPRHRRRTRPRPRPGPRRRTAEGPRLDRDARRTPRQGPRRPRPHPDRARPVQPGDDWCTDGDGLPAAREVVVHAHFDARLSASRRSSVPPAAWRRASAWSCSTRSRPGAATHGRRSPSSPSSTSTPSSRPRRTRSRTGSANRSSSATARACSRGAPAPPGGCDVDHIDEYDHDAEAEGRPQPGPTTTSNLAALCRYHHRLKTFTAWTYRMAAPGVFEWTSPHGHRYRRDRTGTTRIDQPEPPDRP